MTPAQRIREALTEVDDTLDRKGGVAPIIRLATWNKVKDALSALDTIEEGRRWIPVGERLPEESVNVLVAGYAYNRPGGEYWQRKGARFDGKWVEDEEDSAPWQGHPPTHWMPLPPPPKV